MKKLSVDVFADKSRPEGGHAVIRLIGLERLPDSVTFRLKPVDSAQQGEGAWSAGDRHPLVTRMTAEGAELVIGPDIVENPVFLPGTLTAIEIQNCGVRGEFLWPRIPPLMRPKRRHLLGAKSAREMKNDIAEPIAFDEAFDASSEVAPAAAGRETTAIAGTSALDPSTPTLERHAAPIVDGEQLLSRPANDAGAPSTARKDSSMAFAPLPLGESTAAMPAAAKPMANAKIPEASSAGRRRFWPFVATIAAALVFGAIALPRLPPLVGLTSAAPSREGDLITLLSVGTTSPRGIKTRDRTAAELLEAADNLLHAPGGGNDKAEAAFMLRRYLASTLSEERTLLALTQLGSIYAEPDGARAPDYSRARQLWEIAATLGDPVAMCFLASLHEHGLGAAVNKPAALQWYLRAKDVGGCKRIDEAIARLRK